MEDEELDYNSMGVNNKAIDRIKGRTPIELKPVGKREFGKSVVSTSMEGDRKKITTTTPWSQRLAGQGKSYKEAGVKKEDAEQYWRNNPDKYQEYLRSKTGLRTGENVEVRYESTPPKQPTPPKTPKRKAEFYKYRAGGYGGESIGGADTQAGAMIALQKFGNTESAVIDKVYDSKAYGKGAMGRLIQTAEAKAGNAIRDSRQSNPNWRTDLKNNRAKFSQMRKEATSWIKSGRDSKNMPKGLEKFQSRIDNSYERVYTGSSKEKSTSSAAAYKFQKYN